MGCRMSLFITPWIRKYRQQMKKLNFFDIFLGMKCSVSQAVIDMWTNPLSKNLQNSDRRKSGKFVCKYYLSGDFCFRTGEMLVVRKAFRNAHSNWNIQSQIEIIYVFFWFVWKKSRNIEYLKTEKQIYAQFLLLVFHLKDRMIMWLVSCSPNGASTIKCVE